MGTAEEEDETEGSVFAESVSVALRPSTLAASLANRSADFLFGSVGVAEALTSETAGEFPP